MTLAFLILGPFEVHLDGEPLALGGRQQRALLAALTLRANELVSSERLIDELWPEDPPDTADHLVHVYVSRLRKALGDEGRPILVTRPPGYQLVLERGQVDLDRFEDHVAAARSATEDGRFAEASASLREALALWRGPALADVASESFARADAERLNELRVAATEDLMGSELAVGRDDLVPELKSLVAQHPLRERLRGFLMVALYREGRQAEALDAYERTRAVLAEELGIDPSHELQELHRRVLAQDPTLRAATPTLARSEERDDLAHTERSRHADRAGTQTTWSGARRPDRCVGPRGDRSRDAQPSPGHPDERRRTVGRRSPRRRDRYAGDADRGRGFGVGDRSGRRGALGRGWERRHRDADPHGYADVGAAGQQRHRSDRDHRRRRPGVGARSVRGAHHGARRVRPDR